MAMIELDGTTLEGGGQLLRVALSLSAVYTIPIHVTQIRGNRASKSTPKTAGGLKTAHLAAVKWLAEATHAETHGMVVGSSDLIFKPSKRLADTALSEEDGPWRALYEDGRLSRYESVIAMATPGSTCLILQAILPYVLLLPSPVPLRLTIQGGTNVSKSPSIDYTAQVLLPLLSSKLGLPKVTIDVQKRGWSGGRSVPGAVIFEVAASAQRPSLRGFDISKSGETEKIKATVISPTEGDREQVKDEIRAQVAKAIPYADVTFEIDEVSNHAQRCYLMLVAETSLGHCHGADWLDERKETRPSKKQSRATTDRNRQLVTRVLANLRKSIAHETSTDEFLEDQLVVFQAIADGNTLVSASSAESATLHTQTARWVAEQMLGLQFDERGGCKGRGVVSLKDSGGSSHDAQDALPELAAKLESTL